MKVKKTVKAKKGMKMVSHLQEVSHFPYTAENGVELVSANGIQPQVEYF